MTCRTDDLALLARGVIEDEMLEAHARECATCGLELEKLRAEASLFRARVERVPGPPARTWGDVRRRVEAKRPRRAGFWALGGITLAAAAAMAIWLVVRRDEPRTAQPSVHLPTEETEDPPAKPDPIDRATQEYEDAIRVLETDWIEKSADLPPDQRAEDEVRFAAMRETIEDARREAGRDPRGRRQVLRAYAGYVKTLQAALIEEDET
jgi:hypothetical protein